MTTLFDDLPDDGPVHALMPCMAFPCGLACPCGGCGALCSCGGRCVTQPKARATTRFQDVTCPACLAACGGVEGLRAEARRQQGHQAPVVA